MPSSKPKTMDQIVSRITTECLAVRIRMINRTITAIYDHALRPLGVTVGQLNLLVVVAHHGPVSPNEIARRLHMEKSTVSRSAARMSDNGWLNVEPAPSGHKQLLTTSAKGEALLGRSLPAWDKAQTRARAALSPAGASSIHQIGNALLSRRGPQ